MDASRSSGPDPSWFINSKQAEVKEESQKSPKSWGKESTACDEKIVTEGDNENESVNAQLKEAIRYEEGPISYAIEIGSMICCWCCLVGRDDVQLQLRRRSRGRYYHHRDQRRPRSPDPNPSVHQLKVLNVGPSETMNLIKKRRTRPESNMKVHVLHLDDSRSLHNTSKLSPFYSTGSMENLGCV